MRKIISSQIQSVTTGPRQTNMEVLRLVAMAITLLLHANFYALGEPTASEIHQAPVTNAVRYLLEAFGMTGVNCFILISGWFTIRPSVKGACGFLFQCLFYVGGLYLLGLLLGHVFFDGRNINSPMIFSQQYWFIASYLGLYILSPVLNAFLRQTDEKTLFILLCAYFIFQTIGGLSGQVAYFFEGYSILPFIGLYLLGNWIRRIYERGRLTGYWRLLYLGPVASAILCFFWPSLTQLMMYSLINPLIIAGSVALLCEAAKLRIGQSDFINRCSRSCFGIYIISCTQWVLYSLIFPIVRKIYASCSPLESLGLIVLFLMLLMGVCIIVDQVRIILWRPLEKRLARDTFL